MQKAASIPTTCGECGGRVTPNPNEANRLMHADPRDEACCGRPEVFLGDAALAKSHLESRED